MLQHLHATPRLPERVVVVGSGSFVGEAAIRRLERDGVPILPLARKDVDLEAEGAADRLAAAFRPTDAALLVAAIAPCKDSGMLVANMKIVRAMSEALRRSPVAHVVNVGSDAVYRDSDDPLTESSCAEPGSLHGVMHLARELVLSTEHSIPFASVRPTLIYGARDPHNGYGPNRFRRLAAEGKEIVLFGEGEERRDHVLVDDVAELLARVVLHRSTGVLNAATGTVVSFRRVAELVVGRFDRPVPIRGSPRKGPMPHGGYRPFDPRGTRAAFPDFSYCPIEAGIARVHREALAASR